MDDTLSSFIGSVIETVSIRFPERVFKLPAYGRYTSWFKDNFPGEERKELAELIFNDEFYLNLKPILNGFDGHTVEKLSTVCWERFSHIQVVTHREGFMQNPKEVTQEWLKRNGFVDSERVEVHVLHGSISKLERLNGSSVVVDDSITVANDVCASRNHHMILVNHPWNDGYVRRANCTITPVRKMIERICAARDVL